MNCHKEFYFDNVKDYKKFIEKNYKGFSEEYNHSLYFCPNCGIPAVLTMKVKIIDDVV